MKRFPKDLQYAPSAGATAKQLELGTACGKAKHDANGRSKATRMIFAHLLRHHFEKQVGVCVDVALPEQVRRFFAQLVHPLFHPNAAPRGLRRESERSAAIEEGVHEQQPERTAGVLTGAISKGLHTSPRSPADSPAAHRPDTPRNLALQRTLETA